MEREGFLAPETETEARTAYGDLVDAARTVTREVGKAMGFDHEEFDERLTEEVVLTAHDALFASLLTVRIGSREEFEQWRADADCEVVVLGSEQVGGVAWHVAPFADLAVAATFEQNREATVGTLRRQAFGRLYREVVRNAPDGGGES